MAKNCCRVCQQTVQGSDERISLFSTIGERTIACIFAELCGIVIQPDDENLPTSACAGCVESVTMANRVRERCIETDRQLREMISLATLDHKKDDLEYTPKRELAVHDADVGFDGMDDFSQNMYALGANSMMMEESSEDKLLLQTALLPTTGQEQILPEGFLEILNSTAHPQGPEDAPKSCCGCELSFQTEIALQEHSLAAHYSNRVICNAKPYECSICYKRFTDESSLILHGNTRSLCHRCRFCEKRFNDRKQLQFHEKYHRRKYVTKDETHLCDFCGRSFRFRSSLKAHAQLHTIDATDRLYKCSQCERRFLRRTHLRSHEISHSDETPFGCGLCSLKFKRKQHLTAHLKIHEGNDKAYKCRHCGVSFMHQSTRAYHEVSKHTGNYPFSCNLCGRNFFRKPLYDKHIARHNPA
uniref:Protein krueppel n=1 Tax=Anopheles atroparvus TaxID=41427 RepID=A0AAG5CVJ1_ANOAO